MLAFGIACSVVSCNILGRIEQQLELQLAAAKGRATVEGDSTASTEEFDPIIVVRIMRSADNNTCLGAKGSREIGNGWCRHWAQ